MASETRTIHFTVAPELAAYFRWLDEHPPLAFDGHEYDVYADGYRAAVADADGLALTAEERDLIRLVRSEQARRAAVDQVRERVWAGLDEPKGLSDE